MSEEILKVKITGDNAGLDKSMRDALQSITVFGKGADQLGQKVMPKLNKAVADSSNALMNFGRIAQDAPFGLIGIVNNINPMLESFQRLQKESGSTGNALKSMLAGLAGPAGIGVAFSVASSLLLTFGNRLFDFSDSVSEAARKNEAFRKSVLDAFGTVAKEAAQVEVLVATLKREVLSRQQRAEAIRQLQQIAPAYFNTLDAEKFNVEQLTAAYGNYTKSLQRAAEGKVLEKQLEGLIQRRMELEKLLNPPQFVIDDQGRKVRNYIYEDAAATKEKSKNQAELNNLLKAQETIANRLAQIKPVDLVTPFKEAISKLPKEVSIKEVLKVRSDEILLQPDKFTIANADINFDALKEGEIRNAFDRLSKIEPIKIPLRVNVAPIITVDGQRTTKELKKQLQLAIDTALSDISLAGFATIGEAIGTAITGGDIREAFAALGQTIGQSLKSLGTQMIALAPVMEALKGAIRALDPSKGLFSGIALIAIGSAIENSLKIPKLAQGGIIPQGFSGDKFPAMLNSGEVVIPLDRLRNMIGDIKGDSEGFIAMAQVKGDNLQLLLSRNRRSQRRRG